jgi:DNA-binding response OmpR family regulator
LISNACKFSPAGSSVDIALVAEGERVRVGVADHGPGISEAFRQRIFQKFSQEDSSDLRKKGGTGLGLSISKAIVEGLGGEIGFDTEAGVGTTFYFSLPQWRVEAEPVAAAPTQRSRLLVCDADAQAAGKLRAMLDKAGYDSDHALSADEAKAMLREGRYVAMTLDLNLAQPDAAALMRDLRADPASAGLPVIVLSADGSDGELRAGSVHPGIVDWLSTPIDEGRLLADLRTVEGAGARPRILHVEDDAGVRNVVATIAREVADIEAAASLVEARVKLGREKYDLVLLDLGLPDGSGWDLLPLVNAMSPPVRVVIFSARDAEQGGGAAPYAFLVKSQTSEQRLLEVIRDAVKVPA